MKLLTYEEWLETSGADYICERIDKWFHLCPYFLSDRKMEDITDYVLDLEYEIYCSEIIEKDNK